MPILSTEERVGRTLDGKYKVGAPIASGGMGVVYRGEHTWTGRAVAIKVLLPGLSSDADIARRFLTEARASATIRHPNVVDVLDMGRDEDGSLYMILELLEGRDLDDVIEERRLLTPDEAVAALAPILEALAFAHAKGFVHRDIKPSNVYLSIDARGIVVPKILDFGIAKALDGGANKATQTGVIVGTPHYMAPEQASGVGVIGPASDTWSIGVLLFEALSGELPFVGNSPTAILMNVLGKRAPSLRTVAPQLPGELVSLVDAMLEPDADARPADLEAHARALRRCAHRPADEVLRELLTERSGPRERAVAPTVRASPSPIQTDRIERAAPEPATKLDRPAPLPRRASWVPWMIAVAAVSVAAGAIWWAQLAAAPPTEAGLTAPVPTAPVPTASAPTAPVPTAPVPTAPVPTAPVPTAPVPSAPVPTAPAPTASPEPTSAPPATRLAREATVRTREPSMVEPTTDSMGGTMTSATRATPITEVEEEW